MTDPEQKRRLAELNAKLDAIKGSKRPEKRHQEEHYSQAQMAWRLVIELVAGLGIGFGIGYGLDVLFGTLPFLMVIFTLLGFAAGVQTMVRSANEMQRKDMDEADKRSAQNEDEGHG